MMPRTLLILFLFLQSASVSTAFGQMTIYFGELSLGIDVTDDQFNRLTKIRNRLPFDKEINQLEKTIASSKTRLNQRMIDHRKQLESVLTPGQLQNLNVKRRARTQQTAKTHADFMVQFAVFLSAISKAEDLKIYEGIPWSVLKESDKDEPMTDAMEFGGAIFYAKALPVPSSALEGLRSEIVDYRSYQPHDSNKLSRGATPDFCIVWQDKKQTHCAHIFLWGNELVYFGPSSQIKFDFIFPARKLWMKFAATTLIRHRERFENEYNKIK